MRTPYPRPRGVKTRGSFIAVQPPGPRPSEPPSAALVPQPEPTFRFELERGVQDYDRTYWSDAVAVTVNATSQTEACEKAKSLSGSHPNSRFSYVFRVKSVNEV